MHGKVKNHLWEGTKNIIPTVLGLMSRLKQKNNIQSQQMHVQSIGMEYSVVKPGGPFGVETRKWAIQEKKMNQSNILPYLMKHTLRYEHLTHMKVPVCIF